MSHDEPRDDQSSFAVAGAAPPIERIRTIALYDGDTGDVVSRHVVTTFKGARSLSDDDIAKRAVERATADHDRIKGDRVHMARLEAAGHVLKPVSQLKVAISHDARHAEADFVIDPRSGAFVSR